MALNPCAEAALNIIISRKQTILFRSTTPAVELADTVYKNGKIYTVDKNKPWVEAVAIKDGKFLIVGSSDDVATVTGDSTEVVDLGGASTSAVGDLTQR
jgi:hypothetical protein